MRSTIYIYERQPQRSPALYYTAANLNASSVRICESNYGKHCSSHLTLQEDPPECGRHVSSLNFG